MLEEAQPRCGPAPEIDGTTPQEEQDDIRSIVSMRTDGFPEETSAAPGPILFFGFRIQVLRQKFKKKLLVTLKKYVTIGTVVLTHMHVARK